MPHHDIKTNPPATPPRRVATVPSHTDTTHTQRKTPHTTTDQSEPPRALVLTLQILAYAIPLGFLAYVLYINYLPFGYDKTFTIDVGAEGDTTVGEFYLEPSPDLSERKTAADGTTYRELNGMANVIFKPNVVLKDAEITVSVEGEGVSIIPPVIDFNPDDYEWDYEWDFTNPETAFTPKTSERARAEWTSCTTTPLSTGASTTAEVAEAETGTGTISEDTEEFVPVPISATTTEICEPIPVPDLVGNAFFFDGALAFNGRDSRLELPNSADKFEDGPFSVYVEWTPTDHDNDFQQIVGHFNWEILQNKNDITFQVGRMNNATGTTYSIKYPIKNKEEFFNSFHSAIAVYNPSKNGYIALYLDGKFVGMTSIESDVIWKDYGINNFSFGKSKHGIGTFFMGSTHKTSLVTKDIISTQQQFSFAETGEESYSLLLRASSVATLERIKLNGIR